jgi:hypothetical protein
MTDKRFAEVDPGDDERLKRIGILQAAIAKAETSLRKATGESLVPSDQLMTDERREDFGGLGRKLSEFSPGELQVRDETIVPLLQEAFQEGIDWGRRILLEPQNETESELSVWKKELQAAIRQFTGNDFRNIAKRIAEQEEDPLWAVAGGEKDYIVSAFRVLTDWRYPAGARDYNDREFPKEFLSAVETGVAFGIARRLIGDSLKALNNHP